MHIAVHYPGDVIIGSIMGAGTAAAIGSAWDHRRRYLTGVSGGRRLAAPPPSCRHHDRLTGWSCSSTITSPPVSPTGGCPVLGRVSDAWRRRRADERRPFRAAARRTRRGRMAPAGWAGPTRRSCGSPSRPLRLIVNGVAGGAGSPPGLRLSPARRAPPRPGERTPTRGTGAAPVFRPGPIREWAERTAAGAAARCPR